MGMLAGYAVAGKPQPGRLVSRILLRQAWKC
jgi:hypothetical protein